MNIFNFIKKIFFKKSQKTKNVKSHTDDKLQGKNFKNDNNMKKSKKTQMNDKSFHPEILFLINRPYAEYVDFIEIK